MMFLFPPHRLASRAASAPGRTGRTLPHIYHLCHVCHVSSSVLPSPPAPATAADEARRRLRSRSGGGARPPDGHLSLQLPDPRFQRLVLVLDHFQLGARVDGIVVALGGGDSGALTGSGADDGGGGRAMAMAVAVAVAMAVGREIVIGLVERGGCQRGGGGFRAAGGGRALAAEGV